jgi:hypothetical protein
MAARHTRARADESAGVAGAAGGAAATRFSAPFVSARCAPLQRPRGPVLHLLLVFVLHALALAAFASSTLAQPVPAPGSRAVAPHRKLVAAAQPAWRALERECRNSLYACGRVPRGVEDACVLRCQAPSCFAKVYGDYVDWLDDAAAAAAGPQALEPGEVDNKRQGKFSKCLRLLEKALRADKRWPPTLRLGEAMLEEPRADTDTPPGTPRPAGEGAAEAEAEADAEADADAGAGAGARGEPPTPPAAAGS